MTNQLRGDSPLTLGDVLYARPARTVDERDWVALVERIAEGDQVALHLLYEMAHRLVFTLAVRLTSSRETAEEVTIDVFHDVWRNAARFDAEVGSVLAWIMNQTRSRAIDRLRFAARKKRDRAGHELSAAESAADPYDVAAFREQARTLRAALSQLKQGEREAIETTFFAGLTHAEAAARLNLPLGTIKTRIRSGLRKLRSELGVSEGTQ